MATNNTSGNNPNSKPAPNPDANAWETDPSNEANNKGAQNTGQDGTQATASQQQGQGAFNAKDQTNRDGSDTNSNSGQGGNNQTGESNKGGGNSKGSGGGGGTSAGAGQSS